MSELLNDTLYSRISLASNANTAIETLETLATDENYYVRSHVAGHPNSTEELLVKLANDPNDYVKLWVTENPNTPNELLEKLAVQSSERIRDAVGKKFLELAHEAVQLYSDGEAIRLLALSAKSGNTEAVTYAENWLRTNADLGDPAAINNLIFTILIPQQKWEDVELYAHRVIAGDSPEEITNGLSNLGIAKYLQGKMAEAKELFTQALARPDKFAESEASFFLSKIYEAEGELEHSQSFKDRCAKSGGYDSANLFE
jgi:tetratricopeptide (TPR) repeat protein